jgi:predicted permease
LFELYQNLMPVFLFFGLGMLLRRISVLDTAKAGVLLQLMFFALMPAILLVNVSGLELGKEDLLLPLVAMIVIVLNVPVAYWMFRRQVTDRRKLGSLILCSMMINNAMMIPFVLWGYGENVLAYVLLFDVGVAIIQTSFSYGLAFRFSDEQIGGRDIAKKVISSPPLWALIVALSLNVTSTEIPVPLMSFLKPLADMTAPTLLIALGASFSLRSIEFNLFGKVILIRVLIGGLIGLSIASLFGLTEETLFIAVLCSAAPVGFVSTTYSILAKLDFDTAVAMVSSSILLSLIYVPPLMALLSLWISF